MTWKRMPRAHNHEACSSSGRYRVVTFTLTPPGAAPLARDRIYVPVDRCRHYWENAILVPWPDVNLPHGWYSNQE